nr:DExH-box ATP-dependent RNA helicase DExH12-like [Tanacetum cinerariifolium]
MAQLGGGAEARARVNQYDYRVNSNLVLTTDTRLRDTHDDQPNGEAESLSGRIDPRTFGDLAYRGRPDKKKKKGRDPLTSSFDNRQSRRRVQEESVLTSMEEEGVYQPKMKETRAAYEVLLNVIQQQLGGQPLSIVGGAADEILAVLKNDTLKNRDKKVVIEKLLNTMPDQVFDQLVSIGRSITDFHDAGSYAGGSSVTYGDDSLSVAVEFEENDDESDLDILLEDDEEEEDGNNGMQMGGGIDNEESQDGNQGIILDVHDIDAYWLQRKISQAYDQKIDPQQSQKLAEEIVWCTRLARARDQEHRNQIEDDMAKLGPDLVAILDQLHSTRVTEKERQKNLEKSLREEAKRLKGVQSGVVDIDTENGQRLLLDLASIAFRQGGLLMANKKCELPSGSYRNLSKGYEEVHVPALKPKPLADEKLVSIKHMPSWAQPAFSGMTNLNRVQSRVYETALFKADNLLLCAPTGAGKTNVAMLAILQQIGLDMNEDGSFNHSDYKIVYVAPMKALVAEVIEETQIIVTTPEKWDIITRKSGDRMYTQLVKLFIIDEIHLLHDNRGPVLESIVARTVRQVETTKEHIHLVGLSATLPNYDDVALFLRVDLKKGLFHFDNSYRPVLLAQHYIGITVKKPLQRFQLMNDICYEKVIGVAGKHQVLIFVHSRKETTKTARAIRDTALANDTLGIFLKEDSASREILHEHTELVESNDLKDLLPYGLAIHNAGMARADRQLVEDLFAKGHIQVLVSTATLAWGVNLPAHTVIIKGTKIYNPEKGAWTELSPLDVMQMLGRAGRPQYDTYGEGIIITGHILGTIQNAKEAQHWLSYTYLYIRMSQNPSLYGLPVDVLNTDNLLKDTRADLVHSAATILDKNRLVKYDRKSGYFQVTDLGRVASYYYISHGTIATYNEHLKPTMGDIELCWLFSLSEEFKYVTVRQDEKMELANLLDRVPIPIKEGLEEPSAKINVLLQACISQLKLEGLSLTSDMVFITQSAGRLMRAIFEIALKQGWAKLAGKALNLCKMINKRMWSVQTPLRQFHGVKSDILMKLERKDLAWERYYDLSSQELGELVRANQFGRKLHKCIHQFPKLNLAAHVQPITHTTSRVELTITPDFQWEDRIHGYVEPFWVIVEDNDGEYILHHEYFLLKKQYIDEDHTLSFIVQISEPLPPQYFIKVVSDRWLGSLSVLPVSFCHLILPEKYPPPTELLDLQPLPVTALRNPLYESLYQELKHFNPIQTQAFTVLYNTDDNVLVAAPTGSGKTVCAEFSVLRNHQKGGESVMRAVYIAPVEALAKGRYSDWQKKFGDGLGLEVSMLTGETAADLKLLEKSQIIISTPDRWDALAPLEAAEACSANLGEWIGAMSHGIFNFTPRVRPVPLEVHIQAIVFVPTRKHARLTAVDLMTYSSAESKCAGVDNGAKPLFLLRSEDELAPFIDRIREPMLKETLKYGVGYLHEGLTCTDQDIVETLFKSGSIQDAVDYLTWTFMYRRLTQNPNYYNLQGVSQRHLSDYLSELVENTLSDLEASKCVTIDEDVDVSPDNLEEELIRKMINHQRFSFENPRYADPHVKANALLQAHFSRQRVGGNLVSDQHEVLLCASALVQAIVNVISLNGWLTLALLAMEVSQMLTHGMWERDSPLLQLPHFTKDLANRCKENPGNSIKTVFDLLSMEEDERLFLSTICAYHEFL